MYLLRWFRLLDYLTLGLACWCLVYAEALFLPGLEWSLPVVAVVLLLAWWLEGRWLLPAWGANLLSLLILGAAALWGMKQYGQPDSWLRNAPMPAGLIPPLGPILMALLLIKLFRPRLPADFWLRQGMGLLQVALACVLATGPELGLLLAAYLTCGLGCLAVHHLVAGMRVGGRPWEERWGATRLLPLVLRWTVVVSGAALVLFLLTPRAPNNPWNPGTHFAGGRDTAPAHALTGFSEEINLRREGVVDVDSSVAFTVQAQDGNGRPKTDLSFDQRWRGIVLDRYADGRLVADTSSPTSSSRRRQADLPDLGPGQFFLTFTIRTHDAGSLFLADPVRIDPDSRHLPVQIEDPPNRRRPLFNERLGAPVSDTRVSEWHPYRYRQAMAAGDATRWPAPPIDQRYLLELIRQPVPMLEEWTLHLLRRLESNPQYRLGGGILPPPRRDGSERGFLLAPEHWEPVAQALTNYLSRGGTYHHSYELHSMDLSLDPVYDFVTNVRKGHCERFAAALMLMLRSVGIPARVVKGYHGREHQGSGVYVVRHSHAHSWVEALIPSKDRGPEAYDFLVLDPTPEALGGTPFSLAHWWEKSQESGRQMWQDLIVEYNADLQADLMAGLKTAGPAAALKAGLVLAGVLAFVVALAWWRRRLRRASRLAKTVASFYGRLLALLARHARLEPGLAQTPREFAETAGAALRRREATAALADLPAAVVDLFYRVRFGGRPLQDAEQTAMDARLDQMAAALK